MVRNTLQSFGPLASYGLSISKIQTIFPLTNQFLNFSIVSFATMDPIFITQPSILTTLHSTLDILLQNFTQINPHNINSHVVDLIDELPPYFIA